MPAPPTSRAAAIEQTVQAAYDIARFTAEDPAAGLPDAADMASAADAARDLDLFHPWAIDAEAAATLALRCEAAAHGHRPAHHQLRGRRRVAPSSRISSSPTRAAFAAAMPARAIRCRWRRSPGTGDGMQRDYWYSSMRDARELAAPEAIGRYAAERALSRLASRKIATCEVPVLFESPLAAGLLGAFVQAASGGVAVPQGELSSRAAWASRRWPSALDLREDPLCHQGQGQLRRSTMKAWPPARATWSRPASCRAISCRSYSARKLGMKTTGHAGGSHNLTLTSRLTQPGDDLDGDAAQAAPRPVRHRTDGPGRQLRHRRLFARRGRLLGRGRQASCTRCTRSPSPATCATC